MLLGHVWGLFTNPEKEWKNIRKENCSVGKCYCSHILLLAAIPPVSLFIGSTTLGWQLGDSPTTGFTTGFALKIAILYYITILVAIFSVGALIRWMSKTYDANAGLPLSVGLAAYSATPLLLVGIMGLFQILWLYLIIGLPALAYSVYLLYTGVPIMMDIPKEKGFLFSSAVLGVGLIVLIAVMAATAILWGMDLGFKPVYIDK